MTAHIPIKAPREDPDASYTIGRDFTRLYSKEMLIPFSSFLIFFGIHRMHDGRVLSNIGLFEIDQTSGTAFPGGPQRIIEGNQIPVSLLGDPAYPLQRWLMKPYPESRIADEQGVFNYHLNRTRVVVERAFGILKIRWRILSGEQEGTIDSVCNVVCACCTRTA